MKKIKKTSKVLDAVGNVWLALLVAAAAFLFCYQFYAGAEAHWRFSGWLWGFR